MGACLEIYSLLTGYEGTFDFKPGLNENGKNICVIIRPSRVLVERDMGLMVADHANSIIGYFSHGGVFVDVIPVPFPPFCIALMPNGLLAASNWVENQVCMIDLTSKQVVRTLEIHNACAICYHEQSDSMFVGRCLSRNKQGIPDKKTGVIEQYCPTTGNMVARISDVREAEVSTYPYSSPQDMVLSHSELIVADEWVVRVYDISC